MLTSIWALRAVDDAGHDMGKADGWRGEDGWWGEGGWRADSDAESSSSEIFRYMPDDD